MIPALEMADPNSVTPTQLVGWTMIMVWLCCDENDSKLWGVYGWGPGEEGILFFLETHTHIHTKKRKLVLKCADRPRGNQEQAMILRKPLQHQFLQIPTTNPIKATADKKPIKVHNRRVRMRGIEQT